MNNRRKLRLCLIGDIRNVHCKKWVRYFVYRGHDVHFVDDHPYGYKNLKLACLKNYTGIKALDYASRLIRARKLIRKLKPDLVHAQQITYHGFLGALSGMHPFMITPWGSDILSDFEGSFINKKIVKFVFDRADAIHYIDQSVIDRVKAIYGDTKDKEFLLNEGVDTSFYKKKHRKATNQVSILFMRVPKGSYNTKLLVEALNIVVNKYGYRNIICAMCNQGDRISRDEKYEKELMSLIGKYGLRRYMKFFKYTRDMGFTRSLMQYADIYVDTMSRAVKGQGTGKTALEAMSSELAIIMPDNPGIELYIKHMNNGIIYRKNDAKSLANSIAKLVKNKKLMLNLGRNARKFILLKLDWNRNMKMMEDKYYELANMLKKKLF